MHGSKLTTTANGPSIIAEGNISSCAFQVFAVKSATSEVLHEPASAEESRDDAICPVIDFVRFRLFAIQSILNKEGNP
jgi:hypothetical protein